MIECLRKYHGSQKGERKMSYKNYNILPDVYGLDSAYSNTLPTEYRQSIEEGLDIEEHKAVFDAVHHMNNREYKTDMANVLYRIVKNADIRADYPYQKPNELEEILGSPSPL